MKSKFRYTNFRGHSSFSDAINRFSTKKYHSLFPPTMLHRFFLLSPPGNKKNKPPPSPPSSKVSPQLPPSKSITATASSNACCFKRAFPSSIGATFSPALPPMPNFLDIHGDLSPHCPLTQEFLPVPPTIFGNANATMFRDPTMKSTGADNLLDINGDSSSHCPLTQEFLPVSPTMFGNAKATVFGNSAMKSEEAGMKSVETGAPLHYYNQKCSP